MAKLIRSRSTRWFTSLFFFMVALATLFFALTKPQPVSAQSTRQTRTATINAVTGFTFSTPQALTHAPIPAVSPCPVPSPNPLGLGCPAIKDQDVEPEIKVDIFGDVYVTAIHGYPGGVDLWKSPDKGATFVYMGIPDGTQDKGCLTAMTACIGGADRFGNNSQNNRASPPMTYSRCYRIPKGGCGPVPPRDCARSPLMRPPTGTRFCARCE